jgi:hypothetical protein
MHGQRKLSHTIFEIGTSKKNDATKPVMLERIIQAFEVGCDHKITVATLPAAVMHSVDMTKKAVFFRVFIKELTFLLAPC